MLPYKPFYLIRHGESEANAAGLTAGGGYDCDLTDKGRQQAMDLAPHLTNLDVRPSKIYSSPMLRAHQTALRINADLDLKITLNPPLHEIDFGNWEGKPWNETQPLMDEGVDPPGGENDAHFSIRIQRALSTILNKDHKEPPMVVAHGGLFHAIGYMYAYGMSPVQNCHLHYFEPHKEHALFPWRVWQYDIYEGKLVKNPAPFCSSQLGHSQIAS